MGFGELEGNARPWKSIRKDIGRDGPGDCRDRVVGDPRRIGAPSERLGKGKRRIPRWGHGGALVKCIWGPCRKSQAESGDGVQEMGGWGWRRIQRSCALALVQERLEGRTEKKEVSWDVLGVGLPEPGWDGWVSGGCTPTSE